jgi:hypothetical protein
MTVKRTQLSKRQLETLIRSESMDSSKLFFTHHVRSQMRARNITNACVLSTLQNGNIKRTPEPNSMKGSIECRMEHFCTGHHVAVIVAVSDDDPDLILVTAMYT